MMVARVGLEARRRVWREWLRFPQSCLLLSLLSGCVGNPPLGVYLLAGPSNAVGGAERGTVQIQPVIIPDYLDTTDIMLRYGPHQVKVSSTAEWGERLSAGIAQALRADLAARLTQDVVTLGGPIDGTARQVVVIVDALDMWPDGRCVLVVHWRVGGHAGHAVFNAEAALKADDESRVAGLAGMIEKLAGRIAGDRFGA